jgi:hypothetical protein
VSHPDPEAERIRSYLQAQAAKLPPSAIVERVRAAMTELKTAIDAVPQGRFGAKPTPDEWSANEVMDHVVAAGAHFAGGILSVLDGRPLPESDRERAPAPLRRPDEWWQILESERKDLFDRALGADPTTNLDRHIDHGMFGSLNWRETLLFLRLHDLDHAGQLRKIAAALSSS